MMIWELRKGSKQFGELKMEEERVDSHKAFRGGQERADGHSLFSDNIKAA
jgi:hypothetical protein